MQFEHLCHVVLMQIFPINNHFRYKISIVMLNSSARVHLIMAAGARAPFGDNENTNTIIIIIILSGFFFYIYINARAYF